MTEATSDLDTLAPEPREVIVGGEKIAVLPFFFGQWPRAIRLFRPVTDAVQRAGIAGFAAGGLTLASDWALRLPQVMDEGGEALIEFVGFAIGKPRTWFDTIGGDDGIALTQAVFTSNADFFARRIAPMLGLQVAPAPTVPTAVDGEASSPASSPVDTPEATSIA